MDLPYDHRVRDLGSLTLALRPDLRLIPQTLGKQPCYVLEDRLHSQFFHVGLPEYTFISLLDGKTTIREAMRVTASLLAEGGFTEQDAAAICKWLLDNGLVSMGEAAGEGQSPGFGSQATEPQGLRRWNPLLIQLPVLHPDRFLTALLPWLGWLFAGRRWLPAGG